MNQAPIFANSTIIIDRLDQIADAIDDFEKAFKTFHSEVSDAVNGIISMEAQITLLNAEGINFLRKVLRIHIKEMPPHIDKMKKLMDQLDKIAENWDLEQLR